MNRNCDNRIRLETPACWIKRSFRKFLKIVTFSMPNVQILTSKTLGSLIRISPNFHTKYRNDCQLTWWNQNCDISIHFLTPGVKWTTIVKSRHNLQFLWDYWTNLDQICTVCRENIVSKHFWIEIAIIEFVSKRQRVE